MTYQRLSRRRTLQVIGGLGTVGLAGCIADDTDAPQSPTDDSHSADEDESADEADTDEDDREPPEHGSIVFVYDDGPIEDYEEALPAHKDFDAPATAGIITDRIGRSDEWMDTQHLDELVAHEWEICSHTTRHAPVATAELVENVPADDTIVPVDHHRHGIHDGLDVELVAADTNDVVTREVTGFESGDPSQLTLDSALGETVPAGSTVRYPAEYMHELLGDSKADLEAMGYEVSTLLAPYDVFDDYSMEFVPEYYDGVANADHGSRINDPDGFNPYETRRHYFIEFTTPDAVQADLDTIAADGLLGVVGAHTFKEEVTEEKIHEMLSWVDERGIEVYTLREAIDIYT